MTRGQHKSGQTHIRKHKSGPAAPSRGRSGTRFFPELDRLPVPRGWETASWTGGRCHYSPLLACCARGPRRSSCSRPGGFGSITTRPSSTMLGLSCLPCLTRAKLRQDCGLTWELGGSSPDTLVGCYNRVELYGGMSSFLGHVQKNLLFHQYIHRNAKLLNFP